MVRIVPGTRGHWVGCAADTLLPVPDRLRLLRLMSHVGQMTYGLNDVETAVLPCTRFYLTAAAIACQQVALKVCGKACNRSCCWPAYAHVGTKCRGVLAGAKRQTLS